MSVGLLMEMGYEHAYTEHGYPRRRCGTLKTKQVHGKWQKRKQERRYAAN